MNILSIVNVADPCGGTLRCALDMVAALPDCEHVVQALQNSAHDWFFDEVGKVGAYPHFQRGVYDGPEVFDLVICHNTAAEFIPPCRGPVIYYAHSATATARNLPDTVDARLCVSHWLANRLGWDSADVLYQPVALPASEGHQRGEGMTIGRICTPVDKKWQPADWLPHFTAVANAFPEARISLVGVPERLYDTLPFRGRAMRYTASPEARSLLHEWDILLYTSSVDESFGRVVREAQRCGCYPIVSNRGGFVEQISGDGTGALITTPEEAVSAVRDWIGRRRECEEACKQHGDATGSLQVWRDGFLNLLSKL